MQVKQKWETKEHLSVSERHGMSQNFINLCACTKKSSFRVPRVAYRNNTTQHSQVAWERSCTQKPPVAHSQQDANAVKWGQSHTCPLLITIKCSFIWPSCSSFLVCGPQWSFTVNKSTHNISLFQTPSAWPLFLLLRELRLCTLLPL